MDHSFHPDIAPELLVRFLSGDVSEQEVREVNQWIGADHRHKKYLDEITLLWSASRALDAPAQIPVKDDLKKVLERIDHLESSSVNAHQRNRTLLPLFLKIAASVTLLICSYFVIQYFTGAPYKVLAASEKTIRAVLPDGTVVFQNKGARISYPVNMDGSTREVTLEGEAYFEVVKDPAKPFLIRAGKTVTQVIGTSFNVRDGNDTVIVTVLTGKVLLKRQDETEAVSLTAGERGIYASAHGLSKAENTDINFLSWKTGELTFRDTPLIDVVRDLNRHFGQHVVLESPALNQCRWTSVHRSQTLDEILTEMELTLSIQVRKTKNSIRLSGNGCPP